MTRAQHGMIIVADVETLKINKAWNELLNSLKDQICTGFAGAKAWIE